MSNDAALFLLCSKRRNAPAHSYSIDNMSKWKHDPFFTHFSRSFRTSKEMPSHEYETTWWQCFRSRKIVPQLECKQKWDTNRDEANRGRSFPTLLSTTLHFYWIWFVHPSSPLKKDCSLVYGNQTINCWQPSWIRIIRLQETNPVAWLVSRHETYLLGFVLKFVWLGYSYRLCFWIQSLHL